MYIVITVHPGIDDESSVELNFVQVSDDAATTVHCKLYQMRFYNNVTNMKLKETVVLGCWKHLRRSKHLDIRRPRTKTLPSVVVCH